MLYQLISRKTGVVVVFPHDSDGGRTAVQERQEEDGRERTSAAIARTDDRRSCNERRRVSERSRNASTGAEERQQRRLS